jgi:hypothetical protein
VGAYVLVGMGQPPVDRVHHERDQDLAFVLRQQPFDQSIGMPANPNGSIKAKVGDLPTLLVKEPG